MLNFHNYYRCLHGTQPLTWDNGLAASAQEWAYNRMNSACQMQHSGYASLGENVAAGTWRGLTGYNYWLSEDDVVNAWYHEPFTYGSSAITINHFTQVVWQGTTRVGCAWAACNASQYEFWVCQYSPQGNIMAAATINTNVPPPCRTRAQCEFVLQGVNLLDKFGTTDKANTALIANQINPVTYNYGARTCLTPTGSYTSQTTPMCIADSTVLPKTIDVTVQNPASTGALTVKINCPSGKALSGTGLVTCQSGNVWNIAGTCGGTPVTAAPNPNSPPPPPTTKPPPPPSPTAPDTSACWGNLLTGVYLSGYAPGWVYQAGLTRPQAKSVCLTLSGCKGITQTPRGWEPRAGSTPYKSGSGENSILRLNPCPASAAEVQAPIQERVPWLFPLVAVIGALIIAIAVVLVKKYKGDRMRAYSGDLGTPEFPSTDVPKVEEANLTTDTDPHRRQEVEPAVLQNQATYSQIPTSPMTTNQGTTFPLSPSTAPQPPPFPPTQSQDPTEIQSLTENQAPLSPEPHPQPPSEWETRTDLASGQPYYHNRTTGVTQWEIPEGPN